MNEIQRLHAPVDSYGSLKCEGCDSEGWESETPHWPCRTAVLLYSEDEIKETLYWYEIWRKWMRAVNYRKKMASGWGTQDYLMQIYSRQIIHQLSASTFFSKLGRT